VQHIRLIRSPAKSHTIYFTLSKIGEKNINPFLPDFMERTQIPKFYRVHTGKKDYERNGVRALPVEKFVKALSLP
jgi:uncharacterized protein